MRAISELAGGRVAGERDWAAVRRAGVRGLLVACALLLGACATGVERRIARYPAAFQALPEEHKVLVQQRRITEGMNKDAVFFAWGPPHRVVRGSDDGRSVEQWKYFEYDPIYRYGHNLGWGYSSYCPGYGYGYYDFGPDVYYVSRDAARVDFRNGVVSSWVREY